MYGGVKGDSQKLVELNIIRKNPLAIFTIQKLAFQIQDALKLV
jgi:hypothetical protein